MSGRWQAINHPLLHSLRKPTSCSARARPCWVRSGVRGGPPAGNMSSVAMAYDEWCRHRKNLPFFSTARETVAKHSIHPFSPTFFSKKMFPKPKIYSEEVRGPYGTCRTRSTLFHSWGSSHRAWVFYPFLLLHDTSRRSVTCGFWTNLTLSPSHSQQATRRTRRRSTSSPWRRTSPWPALPPWCPRHGDCIP